MRKLIAGSVFLAVAATGCSKKEKSDEDNNNSASSKVGTVDINNDPLATLNLSSSLSPKVPTSVTAKGKGVESGQKTASLTSRKKSREACNIRQKIREAKMNQEQMAMDLCFIEAQKGMKAGGKYKMKFNFADMAGGPGGDMPGGDMPGGPGGDMPGGPGGDMPGGPGGDMPGGPGGDMPGGPGGPGPVALTQDPPADGAMGDMPTEMVRSVFLDNSDPENFKVYMCDNDKLTQKIVLSGAGEKGSKGTFKAAFDDNGFSIAMVGAFDNGVTEAGRQRSTSQMAFGMQMGQDKMNMRSSMSLDLSESGISVVKVANESSSSFADFSAGDKEIGVALIGPNVGSALFQRSFTGSGSFFPDSPGPGPGPGGDVPPPVMLTEGDQQQVETSRAYFDSAGQTLTADDSDNFKEGGSLHVKETMFPKLLPENFSVAFEPGDWDCSGAEDFAVDMNSPELKACEEKFASLFDMEQCDGDTFTVGFEEEIGSVIDQRGEFGPPEFDELPPGIEDVPPPPAE